MDLFFCTDVVLFFSESIGVSWVSLSSVKLQIIVHLLSLLFNSCIEIIQELKSLQQELFFCSSTAPNNKRLHSSISPVRGTIQKIIPRKGICDTSHKNIPYVLLWWSSSHIFMRCIAYIFYEVHRINKKFMSSVAYFYAMYRIVLIREKFLFGDTRYRGLN